MKKTLLTTTVLAICVAGNAFAANSSVENAIKSRPDLSTFYEALVNTGVANELDPNRHYTIFAPTNAAFSALTPTQYPCLYSVQCQGEIAMIVRNHIVADEAYISDVAVQKGGLYTISKRFIHIGDQNGPSKGGSYSGKNQFIVDGHNIIYTSWFGGGVLYKIDGVIANPRELSMLQYPAYSTVAQEQTVTTTRSRIAPYPDTVSETTVIRTSPAVVPVYPAYAPAR